MKLNNIDRKGEEYSSVRELMFTMHETLGSILREKTRKEGKKGGMEGRKKEGRKTIYRNRKIFITH
jgi:hypothetical protein